MLNDDEDNEETREGPPEGEPDSPAGLSASPDPRELYARERGTRDVPEEKEEGASSEGNQSGDPESSRIERTVSEGVDPDVKEPLDEERLVELLSEKLGDSAARFVESIERLPTEIPDKIAQGLSKLAAGEMSRDLFPIVEKRVDRLLSAYREVVDSQQKDFGVRVMTISTVLTIVFCTVIVLLTIWSTPSIEDIKKTEALLKETQERARLHPPVVLYKGEPYVRILPGTEEQFKDKTGIHTYAKIPK